MSYHLRPIVPQGQLGNISKVLEEADEYQEAMEQDNKLLAMCELADLYGALESVAENFNLTMADLKKMSDRTKSAFQDGTR